MTYAMLIYRAGDAAPLAAAEDERILQAHRTLQSEANQQAQLHAVARLAAPPDARTVRRDGTQYMVTDGPYAETKEWLVGIYLIDCKDEASALERARQICPTGEHAIEVRPVDWRWQP